MSLRVVHTFGRNAGSTQVFAKEVVRFGRAPENDVVFDPNFDRDASGNHAEARREGRETGDDVVQCLADCCAGGRDRVLSTGQRSEYRRKAQYWHGKWT